ncbi:MAG: hypothetical protein AAB533_00570 [Patescibacteria group bacterium]
MQAVLSAVLAFVFVVVAAAVLYRAGSLWFAGEGFDVAQQIGNALNAIVVFGALGILYAVAAGYGVVLPLK